MRTLKRPIPIHPMIAAVIQTGIAGLDGYEYAETGPCPTCGGDLVGYDKKRKYFASLYDHGSVRDIHVVVRRFRCRSCGTMTMANAPFYPGTRLGGPVVDLCISLAQEMPFNRAALVIHSLGIAIDRGSVRNYIKRGFPPVPSTEVFGFRLPVSILSLSMSGIGAFERGPVVRTEPLLPGRLPPAFGAPPRLPLFEKRDQRDNQEKEEKRPPV